VYLYCFQRLNPYRLLNVFSHRFRYTYDTAIRGPQSSVPFRSHRSACSTQFLASSLAKKLQMHPVSTDCFPFKLLSEIYSGLYLWILWPGKESLFSATVIRQFSKSCFLYLASLVLSKEISTSFIFVFIIFFDTFHGVFICLTAHGLFVLGITCRWHILYTFTE